MFVRIYKKEKVNKTGKLFVLEELAGLVQNSNSSICLLKRKGLV